MPSPSGEGLLQRAPEGVPEVIFEVTFEVIFGVILFTVGTIKSRFRVDGARVTNLINAFIIMSEWITETGKGMKEMCFCCMFLCIWTLYVFSEMLQE